MWFHRRDSRGRIEHSMVLPSFRPLVTLVAAVCLAVAVPRPKEEKSATDTCSCRGNNRVIVIGAGISGLAAASELKKSGCDVIVLEAKDHIGGRMFSEVINGTENSGFILHHGANWIHGDSPNPIWELNEKLKLVSTQWLPQTYLLRTSKGGEQTYQGTDDYIPGDELRTQFEEFVMEHSEFQNWLQGILTGRYTSPDLPFTYFTGEFYRFKNMTRDSLEADEFETFVKIYSTGDCALELFATGLSYFLLETYGDDREYMVGWPGYNAINEYLATGVDVRLSSPVSRIEWASSGVTVETRFGEIFTGSSVLVTVPIGVLQKRGITFVPELPLWKYHAIDQMGLGLLDKIFFRWEQPWWPDFDAFWTRNPLDDFSGRVTASEFYNVFNLKNGYQGHRPSPILLATPATYFAEILETKSDEEVTAHFLEELQRIFPDIPIPAPAQVIRTKWWTDEFAFTSYLAPPLNFDPLSYDYVAQTLGGVLFFAGEGTSRDRSGFVDGAYVTGLREADKILHRCSTPPFDGGAFPGDSRRPANDAAIREDWAAWARSFVSKKSAQNKSKLHAKQRK